MGAGTGIMGAGTGGGQAIIRGQLCSCSEKFLARFSTPLSYRSLCNDARRRARRLIAGFLIAGCLTSFLVWAGCSKTHEDQSRQGLAAGGRQGLPAGGQGNAASSGPAVDLVSEAQRAISRGDLSAAETAIRSHLIAESTDTRALEIAGDIAAMRGDADTSSRMYRAAADVEARPSLRLLDKLVQEQMRSARPFDAVTTLQELIDQYPSHAQARYDLAGMATMIGMPEVATPALQWLASHGGGDPESLLVLADPERVEPDAEVCRKMLQRNPQDLRPEYSLARLDATKLDWQSVIKRLEPVLQQHQDFVPAFALYGRGLIERGEYEKIPAWQLGCPAGADACPDYWLVAGAWGQYQGRHEEAVRAFWEALRADEIGHPEALTRLLLSLKEIGREREAEIVALQISKYSTLRDALKTHLERNSSSQCAAMGVAAAMMDLGRIWEGEGWARLAANLPNEPLADFRERYLAIRSQLTTETPWQLPESTMASQIDLSGLPLVDWAPGVPRNPLRINWRPAGSTLRIRPGSVVGFTLAKSLPKRMPKGIGFSKASAVELA